MRMSPCGSLRLRLAVAAVLTGCALLAAAGPPGAGLTDAEKERFLLEAEIVERHQISTGITGTVRLTLTDGKTTHDAHLQTIDVYRPKARLGERIETDFRDSYRYNIAAYRLDRLLGLSMVPVSVERRVDGKKGAVSWWVDDVLMMEKEREEKKLVPPDPMAWSRQVYRRLVFTELVHNTDPNTGNFLVTSDWQLRMVDFSRAFRETGELRTPYRLISIDRELHSRLRDLVEETLARELKPCLRPAEIKAILIRRDKILKHFDDLIARKGEAVVIRDDP